MKKAILFAITLTLLCACSAQPQSQETQSQSTMTESQNSESQSESESASSIPDSETASEPVNTIIKSGTIADGEHDVSATVNLYSDGTLELLNFNYDGKAPDVYVAIGNKPQDGEFEKILLVTDKLTEVQENTSLVIVLDDIHGFDAVSIYCDAYSEDFGSIVLQDI